MASTVSFLMSFLFCFSGLAFLFRKAKLSTLSFICIYVCPVNKKLILNTFCIFFRFVYFWFNFVFCCCSFVLIPILLLLNGWRISRVGGGCYARRSVALEETEDSVGSFHSFFFIESCFHNLMFFGLQSYKLKSCKAFLGIVEKNQGQKQVVNDGHAIAPAQSVNENNMLLCIYRFSTIANFFWARMPPYCDCPHFDVNYSTPKCV